jgi:hypothetical protein
MAIRVHYMPRGDEQMLTPTQVQPETAHLDALIAKLKKSGEHDHLHLVEHLQTAHAYLLGAMPMECCHNLELANQSLDMVSDKPLRDEARETIAGLLRGVNCSQQAQHSGLHQASAAQAPPMTAKGVAEFFHGDETSFGIFYPKKHVVAVFTSFDEAQAAYRVLSGSGFRLWEIIAVSGAEVERFLEEIRMNRTLWDELVKEVSRFLDTEINLVERYGRWAHERYGFLVARSSTSAAAEKVAELLYPLNPVAMHWFMSGYIRHLTEGN